MPSQARRPENPIIKTIEPSCSSPPFTPTRITIPTTPGDDMERPSPIPGYTSSESHLERIESSFDSAPSANDWTSELWGALRQKKQKEMAKDRSKVQSLDASSPSPEENGTSKSGVKPPLRRHKKERQDKSKPVEEPEPEPEIAQIEIPAQELSGALAADTSKSSEKKKPPLKRQKSVTSFREAPDGRTIVASFDMRGVIKENVHVSFQRHRLVVTWVSLEISETEEDGCLVREKHERNFQRTLPLPEGTRFEEITGAMSGRHLLLRYPNSRSFRVENRSASGESVY
ncbi:hypothetical protein C8J56DRAFT_493510 [Mycena floridula]|nr:hypothetical protein C8J56DRAFT_493510 [Mycena floridula]